MSAKTFVSVQNTIDFFHELRYDVSTKISLF